MTTKNCAIWLIKEHSGHIVMSPLYSWGERSSAPSHSNTLLHCYPGMDPGFSNTEQSRVSPGITPPFPPQRYPGLLLGRPGNNPAYLRRCDRLPFNPRASPPCSTLVTTRVKLPFYSLRKSIYTSNQAVLKLYGMRVDNNALFTPHLPPYICRVRIL